jgi:hypothetical protein
MAILRIHGGLDTMPDDTKDKVIAPKISGLRAPAIPLRGTNPLDSVPSHAGPDIAAERKPLLNAFILNFELSLTLSNKNRQFTFNAIRKAQDAFEEYCLAVDSLKEYVAAGGLTVSPYFSAVRHFEHCVAHLYQAVRCLNALSRTWSGEKQFDHGDGSVLERVQIIHSAIKHMDGQFERGNLRDETSFALFARKSDGTKSIADDDAAGIENVPMWLTDGGLECAKASVTYAEFAEEIRQWYREAEKLTHITPEKKKGTV